MCPLVKSVYLILFAISIRECSTVMVHYEGKCILHDSAYWEVLNSLKLFIVTPHRSLFLCFEDKTASLSKLFAILHNSRMYFNKLWVFLLLC
jgi:hypothetical protein